MELANVGGDVKEEREPADPIEELDFTNFADLGGEASKGGEHLAEKGDDANSFSRWRAFEAGVSFADIEAGNHDSATECKGSNDTQDFELGIAEDASSEFREISIARKVSQDISETGDSASPSVGVFLLVGWSVVYYKSSNACLNYRMICQ